MRKLITVLLIASSAYMGMLQCVGKFALTRKLHGFVQGIGNKWLRWIVFLIFVIIPVYGITLFLDAILFNSIEFWSGKNVIARADFDKNGEFKKTQVIDNEKMVLVYKKYGEELEIDHYRNNTIHKSFLLKKSEPGVFYGKTARGWEKIDVEVKDLQGLKRVVVREGDKIVSEKNYNAMDYAWMLKKRDNAVARIEKAHPDLVEEDGTASF